MPGKTWECTTHFNVFVYQVDIAGWTDADGPLSILPLLDEDSDVDDDGEQYVDTDSDNEDDMHQTSARKKTKVSIRGNGHRL